MTGHEGLDYSEAEWQHITDGARPLEALSANQAVMVHRHWMWANYARVWFDREFAQRDATLSVDEQLAEEWAAAMYVWYGLLWALIEGVRARRIRLGAPLSTDIRRIAEPLREGRNATFHVGPLDAPHDLRLFEIMRDPGSVIVIHRVHEAFGSSAWRSCRPAIVRPDGVRARTPSPAEQIPGQTGTCSARGWRCAGSPRPVAEASSCTGALSPASEVSPLSVCATSDRDRAATRPGGAGAGMRH